MGTSKSSAILITTGDSSSCKVKVLEIPKKPDLIKERQLEVKIKQLAGRLEELEVKKSTGRNIDS